MILMKVPCDWCSVEFECSPSRWKKNNTHCCSKECMGALLKSKRENDPDYLNCTCPVCGKKFHKKQFHVDKYNVICCSMKCSLEVRRDKMTGENNHQFGLKGEKNASWKSDEKINSYGYRLIRVLDHPFCNSDGFVFEHRLVAEKYLLTDDNSVEIGGKKYLKKEYAVHHIDMNKLNNDVSNLIVMPKGEHSRLHNAMTKRKRDSLGRFI